MLLRSRSVIGTNETRETINEKLLLSLIVIRSCRESDTFVRVIRGTCFDFYTTYLIVKIVLELFTVLVIKDLYQ